MKRTITLLLSLALSLCIWARGERQTVVFDVNIHCQGCIDKIEKNIAFERGVKDLICDLDTKTVTIVFDPTKTDVPHLQAAFTKINKVAKVQVDSDDDTATTDINNSVDAQTGASTPQ